MLTPNRLTWFRVVIAVVCPFFLVINRTYQGDVWVILLFTIASITDWLDGYLARKKSMVTGTGKIIDPIADKILILGLMVTFSYLNLYSFWWISLIVIREILVTATRLYCFWKGIVIPAEWAGKLKLGVQMTSVYLTLFLLTALDLSQTGSFLRFFVRVHWIGIILANYFTVKSGALFFKHLKLRS